MRGTPVILTPVLPYKNKILDRIVHNRSWHLRNNIEGYNTIAQAKKLAALQQQQLQQQEAAARGKKAKLARIKEKYADQVCMCMCACVCMRACV
jgi:hypothetical protein